MNRAATRHKRLIDGAGLQVHEGGGGREGGRSRRGRRRKKYSGKNGAVFGLRGGGSD